MVRLARRVVVRVIAVMSLVLAVPAAGQAMSHSQSAPGSATSLGAGPARPAASGIVLASDTVLVPRALVKAQLISITGANYRFRSATGPLGALRSGKVMVLEGTGAAMVTGVQHKGTQLVVSTRDATLGEVVKSGTISFAVTPDFSQAITAPFDVPGQTAATAVRPRPETFAARQPLLSWVHPAERSGSLAIQGSLGPFGYSIGGTVSGPGKVDLNGQVCAGYSGAECGNGPSSNPAWEIGVSGTLDLAKIDGAIQIAGGGVKSATAAFRAVRSQLSMNYTFSRGEGGGSFPKWPPLKIPFGWDIPIPNPYVPLFVRVQFAALVQVLTKPAKNTVTHGGLETSYSGSATAVDNGNSFADSGGADAVSGKVDAGKGGLGVSLGNFGVDLTFQEKAGIALGVSSANLMAFTDFTSTIGQEHASAIAGGFCSSYIGVSDWGIGLGGEIGGPLVGLSGQIRKSLVKKTYNFTEPGCSPISG